MCYPPSSLSVEFRRAQSLAQSYSSCRPILYSWSHCISWASLLVPSPLRGWHANLWLVHTVGWSPTSVCVHGWCTLVRMQSNCLQLNTNKTELLWCTTARRQHQLPRSAFRIGSADIIPTTAVRDLGIYIDADLSMRSHVQRTVAGCFAILRQLRSRPIGRSVPSSVFQTLLIALVMTRLWIMVMPHCLVFLLTSSTV